MAPQKQQENEPEVPVWTGTPQSPSRAHQHTTRGHPQLSTAPLSAPKTPVGPSLEEEQPQTPPWPGQKRRWVRAIYPPQRRGAVTDQTGEILNRGGSDLSLLQPHRGSLIHHQPAAPSSFFFFSRRANRTGSGSAHFRPTQQLPLRPRGWAKSPE